MLTKLRQWWCGVAHSHNFVWEHDGERQWLRCVTCWKQTPGFHHGASRGIKATFRVLSRLRAERNAWQKLADDTQIPVTTRWFGRIEPNGR